MSYSPVSAFAFVPALAEGGLKGHKEVIRPQGPTSKEIKGLARARLGPRPTRHLNSMQRNQCID